MWNRLFIACRRTVSGCNFRLLWLWTHILCHNNGNFLVRWLSFSPPAQLKSVSSDFVTWRSKDFETFEVNLVLILQSNQDPIRQRCFELFTTHTPTISNDAGLSLISLFNQSRGSPSQQYFPVEVNLTNKQRDDNAGQESNVALCRLLPALILSRSLFPFISFGFPLLFHSDSLSLSPFFFISPVMYLYVKTLPLSVYLPVLFFYSLVLFLVLSIWLIRDKDCNFTLNRCWEIIPHIVFPWQTSPSVYAVYFSCVLPYHSPALCVRGCVDVCMYAFHCQRYI